MGIDQADIGITSHKIKITPNPDIKDLKSIFEISG